MSSLSFGLWAAPLLSSLFSTAAGLPSSQLVSRAPQPAFTRSGCFTDAAQRALAADFKGDDNMTVEMCAAYCSSYQYFGLEYGRECYCGNQRGTASVTAPDTDCSFACAGDATEQCGGSWRLDVYTNNAYVPPQPPVQSAPSGAPYLGCFVDLPGRVLPDRIISEDHMTAARCAANCEGYKYFGTEWSRECYCGNTAPAQSAPEAECSMACTGNAAEMCGAGMRLSVYGPVATTSSPGAGSNPATIGAFSYDGCYSDAVALRVLSGKTAASADMTLASCAAICAGYTYFGVEYSSECYCGMERDASSVKSPEADCKMKCGGDQTLVCGDANRLTVYKKATAAAAPSNPQTVGAFTYRSCWTDAVGARSLVAKTQASADMTVEKCAAFCDGYAFFGVEYATECFCGNELAGGQASPEADCSQLCGGNLSQWCGGPNRLNLYAASSPSTTTSGPPAITITPPPQLTTITSCPPSSTLVPGQASCWWKLPYACNAISTSMRNWFVAQDSMLSCSSTLGSPLPTEVATCFPTPLAYMAPITPIYSCISSAGITCRYASDCATNTYTVGSEPTATVAPPAPTNPALQNPGFESGAVAPWIFVRPKTAFSTEEVSAVHTHSNSGFAYRTVFLNDDVHQTILQQTVAVTPGGNYTFSVWISSDNPVGSNCDMFAGATPTILSAYKVLSFSNVAAGAWQQLSVDFQAHASFLKVQMNIYCAVKGAVNSQGGRNTMYLDDALLVSRDP